MLSVASSSFQDARPERAVHRLRGLKVSQQTAVENAKSAARLWLLFVAIYFPMMTTLPLYIDAEIAATRDSGGAWIAQGRWMTYVLLRYILPFPVVPAFTVGLFGLCAAIAYMLVLRGCRQPFGASSFLAFAAFAAFPIWSCLLEFPANTSSAGFGLLLCGVVAYTVERHLTENHKVFWAIVMVVSATAAIGTYQAFAFVALVVGLAVVFFSDSERKIRDTISVFALIVASIAMHLLIQKLFVTFSGIPLAYIEAFMRPDILLANPLGVVGRTIANSVLVLTGARSMFGTAIWASGFLIALAAFIVITQRRFISTLLLLMILLAPFPLMLLAGGLVPMRTLLAVPGSICVCSIVVMNSKSKQLRITGYILTGTLAIQSAAAISQYQAERLLAADFDRQMASRIYEKMSEVADLSKPQKFDIYGGVVRPNLYSIAVGSTAGASFFSWDGGNIERMSAYLQMQGYKNLVQLPGNQRRALKPEFNAMPVFPANGSVRLLNDVVLVKLGLQSGYYSP
ncbi:glucosyltransferase domain-containing protein [Mesorhizobium sp. B2-4-6]|uniref:glucosyltransferase domain-containing protein n=1 Tax=Mesorhizobium sp. B2-4-6 TaxID=2589943 RepID=UPI0015E45FF5|nr:glucosyltransferase domain-containing protein [Mesorhizobium sp. B2-4-6]